MEPEQKSALQLIERDLNLTQLMEGVEIAEKLREMNVSPQEMLRYIKAAHELSDPEFRKAAHAALELVKKTGKTPVEAGAYIEELSPRIEGKKKEKSEWEEKAEKAKEEAKGWGEKRKDEKAEFEKEQSLNRTALERSKQEFEEELRQQGVVRENVEKFIDHEARLRSIGLDSQTFDSILGEVVQEKGITPDIGKKVKGKIKQVGSLDKAIAEMEKNKKSKEEKISKLSKEELGKNKSLEQLNGEIEKRNQRIGMQEQVIENQEEEMRRNKDQYELFETFISMLLGSPSAEGSLSSLGERLQRIGRRGWGHSTETTPEERRTIFLLVVMGTYLRSVRCYVCGTSFLVNKPRGRNRTSYYCPVCGPEGGTGVDDSFLKLMVSPDLSKLIYNAKSALKVGGQSASD